MNTKPIRISWQGTVLKEMGDITVKPYKRAIGVAFDQDNIDFINKMRGRITLSEYVNGVITAVRLYHQSGKNKK